MNPNTTLIIKLGTLIAASAIPLNFFASQSTDQIAIGPMVNMSLCPQDPQNSCTVFEEKTDSEQNNADTVSSRKELKSRLEIGGDYTRVNLKVHGHGSFKGNLGGAQGLYEYRPANRFYGAAKATWKQGNTHGKDGSRFLLYADGQERMGYTFGFMKNEWLLTLFSGFGIRHLGHKLKPKEGKSVRLNYNEFYFPTGLLTNYAFNSWFALGAEFAWMPQIFPTVTIRPINGARWKLTNNLNNYYAALPIDFTLTKGKRFHLLIKPFYEYWKDGHSTAKTTTGIPLGLPGNTYNFWGVDLNLCYCF